MPSLSAKAVNQDLFEPLCKTDQELLTLIDNEKQRQLHSINLIASENCTSRSVFEALGTPLSNKYSEGYPHARYYGGNEVIDQIELLCQDRALKSFRLDPNIWGVNVQCHSGCEANLEVYTALMKPHERLMGLYLPDGGHLSHGYSAGGKSISAVATYFDSLPYRVDLQTGLIDYEEMERSALLYRPKVIIAGSSAYCRLIDYQRMREIADKCGAYLMADMAHISGLVAANLIPSPFTYADVVTTTTHKSLRGPRGAMIFYRKTAGNHGNYNLEMEINASVFPGHQGGPHNHTIAALATALKQAQSPKFKEYQIQVLANAKALEKTLRCMGYDLVSDGTDIHMILVSLDEQGVDGARVEYVCDKINISINRNSIPGDRSALLSGGVRLGTPAMTSRGMNADDFCKIAKFFDQAVIFTRKVQHSLPMDSNKLKDFKKAIDQKNKELEPLKNEISAWSEQFPLPI